MTSGRLSLKAKIENDGMIWLPLPKNLSPETRAGWANMLKLASHSKCQVGIRKDGEILFRTGPPRPDSNIVP